MGRTQKGLDGSIMDKFLHSLFNGAFALIKGPLIFLIMASVVISLVRQSRARLVRGRVRKQLPPA